MSECVCECVCECVNVFVVIVCAGMEPLWISVLKYYDRNKGHFHLYKNLYFAHNIERDDI